MTGARPVIATGQQIGAGWSPALSVAKALAALAEARRSGAEAVYWLTAEDNYAGRMLYDRVATRTPFIKYQRDFS